MYVKPTRVKALTLHSTTQATSLSLLVGSINRENKQAAGLNSWLPNNQGFETMFELTKMKVY